MALASGFTEAFNVAVVLVTLVAAFVVIEGPVGVTNDSTAPYTVPTEF